MILKPQTPIVFAPLWERSARYKGAWGGRGSAKSWDRAQAVIINMATRPGYRIACLREVQNSLKDSVQQLLIDTTQRLGIGPAFDSVESEMRGPNGSLCIFRGMKDQNADSIKSLEGFDAVWWEEAQTATQRSMDLLRPTIRKPGSEIWFTWNPRKKSDPVDRFLRQQHIGDPDFLVVEAQWSDNPWISDVLLKERTLDLIGDPDRYAHIWEGAYESDAALQLISERLVSQARERTVEPESFDEKVMGVDVARFGDDSSVIYFRHGRDGSPMPYVRRQGVDTMALAALVADWITRWRPDSVFVDEGGVGGGVVDRLAQLGFREVRGINFGGKADSLRTGEKAGNKRTEMWLNMRQWLARAALPKDELLAAELTGPMYSYNADNAMMLEKKADMKKRGVPSPDVADALALTFAYPVQANTDDDWADEHEERGRSNATGY